MRQIDFHDERVIIKYLRKPTDPLPLSNSDLILHNNTINTNIIHDWTSINYIAHFWLN